MSSYVTLARGFLSSGESMAYFGLGQRETIDELTIRWPSGREQRFENLASNMEYTITEPAGPPPAPAVEQKVKPMFVKSDRLAGIVHKEKEYNDFERQPLLPNKLSQLGAATAWGDVDNDGDYDMYVCGSADEAGQILLNPGSSGEPWDVAGGVWYPFHLDAASEDMAALFLDVDSDGDQDLYVMSGGVECEANDERLRDRLYINQGDLDFVAFPEGLPDNRDSGGALCAADYDRDGDLDLFVGGRVVPGEYPSTPASRLLENQGGKFVDVTTAVAPGLSETGLVTGAIWSDADNDGDVDLLVTHEWGPVKFWRNDHGQLSDRTDEAQLATRRGWYNSIAARDVDNDGDIDYVVTNFGLNTKYHPSDEKPDVIYYGHVDDTGKARIIEAKYQDGRLVPVRGKACSTRAIPGLADKFKSYHDFALADLAEIYTQECLQDALRCEVNSLESGVLLNDGQAVFTFLPLPRLAQISPGFGVSLTEVDGDGFADLYIVQNFFGPQAETGRFDGGLSQLLTGNGDGTFTLVGPDESGLIVPGDAMGLVTADLNDDGWPDFVVSINDGELVAFENRAGGDNRVINVALRGKPGNLSAVGARVTLTLSDGSRRSAEVVAGDGYLSQSPTELTFGLGAALTVRSVAVQWPDGTESAHDVDRQEAVLEIAQP